MSIASLRALLPSRQSYINMAAVDSQTQADNALASAEQDLREKGVNPSSGRFVMAKQNLAIDAAANKAANMTRAGNMADQATFAQEAQIASLEQQQNRDNWNQLLQSSGQGLERARLATSVNQWNTQRQDDENASNSAANSLSLSRAISRPFSTMMARSRF